MAELRRFVRSLPNPDGTCRILRGPPLRLDELVTDVIDVLARHGDLDDSFFVALRVERPQLRTEIDQAASKWQRH